MKTEDEKFHRGLALFNAGKFFEAHEAWEDVWLAESGPEKTFLQGLIQVAAALHHAQRSNTAGMRSLLAAGLGKLSRFGEVRRGIAVERFCRELRDCAERLTTAKDLDADGFPKIARAVDATGETPVEGAGTKIAPPSRRTTG